MSFLISLKTNNNMPHYGNWWKERQNYGGLKGRLSTSLYRKISIICDHFLKEQLNSFGFTCSNHLERISIRILRFPPLLPVKIKNSPFSFPVKIFYVSLVV